MPAVCKTAILKAESFNLFMNTLYFNLKSQSVHAAIFVQDWEYLYVKTVS